MCVKIYREFQGYADIRVLSERSSKYEFTVHISINTKKNALAGWFPQTFHSL